jgi:Helix-turn-helix domain
MTGDTVSGNRKDQGSPVLSGTTLRVYRYLFRRGGSPSGFHEIQRGCGLSSPSVAQYHIKKLLEAGLIKEQDSGYVVDRVLFENMIRIRKSIVPMQITFIVFFISTLILLLTLLRPNSLTATYFFSVAINIAAIALFGYETNMAWRRNSI